MQLVLALLQNTVCIILSALQLAMFIRAIMSWFPTESNKFENFLYVITEPLIIPIRKLFEKFNWFQGLPIDISFFVTYLLLSIITLLLSR
ncbi:MAG: YggT family protein [Clostridia bacterium]|nr:YggT family protein [Clostridia bacterium]MBR2345976.1 YggT family protein [Clostridia bacterium]MBR2613614.1 YggT family protein [Clostridia bacterium]MBR2849954.1 YggT family protein [Clostridia bacterium]